MPQSLLVTTVLVTLMAVVVALLVVLGAGVLRSQAQISVAGPVGPRRDQGRETRPAADITGSTPDGEPLGIRAVGTTHPTMLVFLSSTCTTCAELWDVLADRRKRRLPGDARLVVVTKGEEADSPARLRRLAPSDIPVVMSTEAWHAYGIAVAPRFAYVGESGVVTEGSAASWDDLVSVCDTRARLS